jgi:hypothetical protein
MKKATVDEVLRNYDNRELGKDEELVTYFKNEADAENLKNPDSIVHQWYGKKPVIGVRTAFKKGDEADLARKQFNSYINDLTGKFHCAGATSTDGLKDVYDLEKGSSNEDPAINYELAENAANMVLRLTQEAPQLMAAVIFHRQDLTGKDFEEAMHISHDRSAKLQKKLTSILNRMIYEGYDAVDLDVRTTKNDEYYLEVIKKHMEEVLDDIIEITRQLG